MNNNNNNNNDIKPCTIVDVEKGQLENEKYTSSTTKLECNNISSNSTSEKAKSVLLLLGKLVGCVALIATVTLIWYYMGWMYGVPAVLVAILAILITSGKWRWLYIAAITVPRDTKALLCFIKLLIFTKRCQRKNASVADVFAEHVAKQPDKTCLIFEGQEWTFKDVHEYSNKLANVFHAHGYKNGDVVGLLLENRPEFVCIWLGLSKLGVIIPLINNNLRKTSLVHSIMIAKCSALIYGESLTEAVTEIAESLPSSVSLYQLNEDSKSVVKNNAKDLSTLLSTESKEMPMGNVNSPSHHDQLLYIYTSGTTGLPKAAVITHARFIFIVAAIHYMARFKKDDVFYTPLPLYHTAGGIMSVGQALMFGSSVAIRKKFSASSFFTDCQKFKCTVAQYIGEMCRYILTTPESSADKDHNIRLIFGNGLRPQIWPQFVERFNIPRVAEFYGATEGNANIVNIDNTVGAIGFVSRIIPSIYPISIIRADSFTGEPIRGPDGLCQLCEPNEPGVFIGKIIPNNPTRAFLGYVDKKASDKKIVRDVFTKGDSAFLSGDLIVADERGNLFFKDRTGDTFRWKGENVSTSEVEAHVSNDAGYRDTVVFGVEIPHMEGRAGMAAILDPENKVDLVLFADRLKESLPSYARPLFIRLLTKVDMTGTFKLKKLDLQKEAFDPNIISDPLYYLTKKGQYDKLTIDIYNKIENGELRF